MNVKICGVCRPEDAAYAARAGAHFVGVILAQRGPRAQSLEGADAIFAAAAGARRVGVFADQDVRDIAFACDRLALDVIQLHGHESAAFAAAVQRNASCTVWKAVTLAAPGDLERAADEYGDVVHGLLLDGPRGGSGTAFDWALARNARTLVSSHLQIIVAGGLNASNVQQAITTILPHVVDVASGVEENVCIKSKERIDEFIRIALR